MTENKNQYKIRDFNEATRVQMPALLHLTRIGYKYLGRPTESSSDTKSISDRTYDPDTNILIHVFEKQFKKLNPTHEGNAKEVLKEIIKELDNDDLGRSFYKRLTTTSPIRLIDFENPDNNVFHCTAEFTCKNGQDEFRPDITLFVNGMPLVFIEVKKPNNIGGMIAESKRMNKQRFPNKKFRKFINITQFMIFSNNMEYDSFGGIAPIQGAFYCTTSRNNSKFSSFREENKSIGDVAPFIRDYPYLDYREEVKEKILSDFNCQVIRNSPEYETNLNVNTPTNRIITSMCSFERLLFLLKYGIAYVKMEREIDEIIQSIDEKHIMRYQQLFATLAVRKKLDDGFRSGIIWHTQGSGKTALTYYLTYVLTDYYTKQNKVAKFYFIVDRLDLLEQATQEFEARGLEVKTADTRYELMKQFRTNQSQEGKSGKAEITVVNIQRFAEDKKRVELKDYATNLQRVFIIDEAHRSYDPKGCFLANLFAADTNSVKIALTGTPLLKEERASCKVFGDYIHTYYYDKSIQDGYTLKIIREDIETSYKEKLTEIYDKLEILVEKRDIKKSQIIEHESYVKELLKYIIQDLRKFRQIQGDETLGGMIICETSEQARKLVAYFDEVQKEINSTISTSKNFRAGLILHDNKDKEARKQIIKDFKKNMTIDLLVVYNMLLTGFDAPRLKRMYLGRRLKDHNLLQALTRVNRPYKDNFYGYIIDFADIKRNFDQTNEAYLRELNRFNDFKEIGEDNMPDTLSQIIEDPNKLISQMREVRQELFNYTLDNTEKFSTEISTIEDKEKLIKLKKALILARDSCNIVRSFGDEKLKKEFSRLEIIKLPIMLSEIEHCINIVNQKEALKYSDETKQLINQAMEEIEFNFKSISKEEMKFISDPKELDTKFKRIIRALNDNIDKQDPEYITLHEAFMQKLREHGFKADSTSDFNKQLEDFNEVLKKLTEIKNKNDAMLKKYNEDIKFVRVHKRIREENIKRNQEGKDLIFSLYDEKIVDALNNIKLNIDSKVYDRNDILKKDDYFERIVMNQIIEGIKKLNLISQRDDRLFIQEKVSREYLEQYNSLYNYA